MTKAKRQAYNRAYHAARREERIVAMRARRAADPERDRERCRQWRKKNAERKRNMDRAYYLANRDRIKERVKSYTKANRAATNAHKERHRLLRRGGGEWAVSYRQVLLKDPCSYCGGPGGEIDHIDPISHGGSNAWANLTAACRSCNARKRTQSLLRTIKR